MKKRPALAILVLVISSAFSLLPVGAEDQKAFSFDDHFERNESQELTDEVGAGWSSNSEKETKGKSRQFDLKDGALHVFRYEGTKHPASLIRETDFKNATFEMRFLFEESEDSFELTFMDRDFADSKNGQLFAFEVGVTELAITEQKTGSGSSKYREAAKAGTLTPEQEEELKAKKKVIPNQLETGKWHDLLATIKGDTLSLSIDGKEVGTFSSEGVAHPKKGRIRLSFPRKAVIDDVRIRAAVE